ncbi:MAG: NUDIX domain-containing protein [bacterium]|nr:NUDIX domain-containing protein [bacterium]
MIKEISAGIIIYRKTEEGPKFLILYHRGSYWNFPKGKIESEEKSFQTASREIKEETGLNRSDLKFDQFFKAYEKFNFWRKTEEKPQRVFKIVIFYLAETRRADIRLSKEHSGYGWFTFREALKILSKHKDSQRVLRQAHEALRK